MNSHKSATASRSHSASGSASKLRALVVVAYPQDVTRFGGGTILMSPEWSWHVVSLFHGPSGDEATQVATTLDRLHAVGSDGALAESTAEQPLAAADVRSAVNIGLGDTSYDMILTHSPLGNAEGVTQRSAVGDVVLGLWSEGKLTANELWMFAYGDGDAGPAPLSDAHLKLDLTAEALAEKRAILRDVCSAEEAAEGVPTQEGFWRFGRPSDAIAWQASHSTSPTPPN